VDLQESILRECAGNSESTTGLASICSIIAAGSSTCLGAWSGRSLYEQNRRDCDFAVGWIARRIKPVRTCGHGDVYCLATGCANASSVTYDGLLSMRVPMYCSAVAQNPDPLKRSAGSYDPVRSVNNGRLVGFSSDAEPVYAATPMPREAWSEGPRSDERQYLDRSR
jgi:hypothetical protein